jgi:hypothetical protein
MTVERVELQEVLGSAERIIIRTDVGFFTKSGPQGNIITVESMVAFSTAVNELYREGYQMVSPQEYAATYWLDLQALYRKIREEGSVFLLVYPQGQTPREAVPLEERVPPEDLGPHLSMF